MPNPGNMSRTPTWTNKREPHLPGGDDDLRSGLNQIGGPGITSPLPTKENVPAFNVAVWVSASAMVGTFTAGAGDGNKLPQRAETAVNLVNYDYLAFDPTTSENAFFQYKIPIGWDEGKLTFRYLWTNTDGVAGGVVFGLKAQPLSDNDTIDTAWGTEILVTDSWQAQNKVHISPISTDLTIGAGANGTAVEGDIVMFNLARKTADAGDTMAGDCRILGLEITFRRTTLTD